MIHGKDIIIYEGSDEPVAIAASKSCTIDKQAGTVETSSPASGTARSYASGRTDWVCTMNNLVLSVKDNMLRVGETYFITMGVRGSSTDTITGYAICTECNITGTVGNLAQGSFRFQGSDRDGTLPPQPGETGYDMTVDQVTAIVYNVVGDGYLSRLHNDTAQGLITFNAGAYIPTGQSLRIGDAYLTYDAQNKMIKVWDGTGNEVRGFYATGSVSALGAANGSGGGGGGGDLDRAGLFNILTGVPHDASEWISAKFLKLGNGLTAANDGTLSISGAVTSVGLTMPTGFTVTGSPITSSGTLAVSLASGYKLLTSSTATPGTYTKVTVDTYGRVTGGTSLAKADIPTLDYIPLTGSNSISGKLEPLTDASYDIGASGYRWRNGYFSGTVHAATFDGNAASASKLNTSSSYSVFGQTYWSNGVPQTVANNAVGQMKYLSFRNNANNGDAGYVGAGSTVSNDIALIAYSGNNLLLGANGKAQATFDGSKLELKGTTSTPLKLKGNNSNSTWISFFNSSDTLIGYLGADSANGGLRYSNGSSYWNVLHTGNYSTYLDDIYVNKTGDTMTNTLNVSGNNHGFKIIGSSYTFGLHMGSSGTNRGIYQWTPTDKWLLYFDANNTILNQGSLNLTAGSIITTHGSSNHVNGSKNAVINCNYTSYGAILNAPVKSGRISMNTYPQSDDYVRLSYFTADNVTNNVNTQTHQLRWLATTGQLLLDGHLNLEGAKTSSSTSNTTQIIFRSNSTEQIAISSNTNALIINPTSSATTGQIVLGVNGKNTCFTSSGKFGIGTTSPSYKLHVAGTIYATDDVTALSDMRYKNVVKEIEVPIEDIAKLPVFDFTWKDKKDDLLHSGSSAQAIQKLFPHNVLGKDELSVNYGATGTIIGILVARGLIKLGDETNDEIAALKEEIVALKQRIKTLEEAA